MEITRRRKRIVGKWVLLCGDLNGKLLHNHQSIHKMNESGISSEARKQAILQAREQEKKRTSEQASKQERQEASS
jgi:hypothetical protein